MAFDRLQHGSGAVVTTLVSDITAADTTANIVTTTGWPDGSVGPFYIVIDPGQVGEEKILATARSGASLTGMTRGADGTTAAIHLAGAVVEHIFSGAEADEANQTAVAFLGGMAAKGDSIWGTGSHTAAKQTIGAANTVVIADTSTTTGVRWGQVDTASIKDVAVTTAKIGDQAISTGKLAANSVTTDKIFPGTISNDNIADDGVWTHNILDGNVTAAKIANGTITTAKLSTAFWHYATFSGTTDSNGLVTVTHGAAFTPTVVLATPHSPNVVGGDLFSQIVVDTIGATTFRVRCLDNTGAALQSVAVTGSFLCLP